MGHKNREIEKKFVCNGKTLDQVASILRKILPDWERMIHNASRDYYWKTPKGLKADFVRLRCMPDKSAQLTLKHTDQGSTLNRIEIDVELDSPNQAKAFMEQLVGPPDGSIYKEYYAFFLDRQDTNISAYRVRGDKRVFLEVEARSVERLEKALALIGTALEMTPEPRSLFQVFIDREKE